MSLNFKVACLLAVVAVVVCNLGGYQDVTDTNSAIVDAVSRLAKQNLLESNNNACEEGLERVSAQEQLVNGKNYKFVYNINPTQCGGAGAAKSCTVVVHVSIDETQKTITSSDCQPTA